MPRFRLKTRAFELTLRQSVFVRAFGRPEFEVLAVARDALRLERLRATARREVAEERRPWWSLAAVDVLHPYRFGDFSWLALEGQRVRLLHGEESQA